MVTEGTTAESAWAPLSHPVFRALWIASLVSNIGTWMLVVAALLAVLAFVDLMTPTTLLVLTFALGIGVAMNTPTWQAITPELVPPSELTRAVALNALPINIGRAIGPAVGGVLVAAAGPALVFALNAVSFVAVLAVVYRWRRQAPRALLPAERVIGATRAGLRYARHARRSPPCSFEPASSSCAAARSGPCYP